MLISYIGDKEEEESVEVKRYYFLFMNGELEFLLSYFQNIRILKRFFDGQNWCVELEVIFVVSIHQTIIVLPWMEVMTKHVDSPSFLKEQR